MSKRTSKWVVYKMVLIDEPEQLVALPVGAIILCAHEQNGVPCLWYLCDPDTACPRQMRRIVIVPEKGTYAQMITAALLSNTGIALLFLANLCAGWLVWRLYW